MKGALGILFVGLSIVGLYFLQYKAQERSEKLWKIQNDFNFEVLKLRKIEECREQFRKGDGADQWCGLAGKDLEIPGRIKRHPLDGGDAEF